MLMARNRKLIHCLMILCIGLMPVFSLSASELQHVDHASSGCLDCNPIEMAIDLSCGGEDCVPSAHACGANFCAGFVPENAVSAISQSVRLINSPPVETSFRSHLAESIYRPPIS